MLSGDIFVVETQDRNNELLKARINDTINKVEDEDLPLIEVAEYEAILSELMEEQKKANEDAVMDDDAAAEHHTLLIEQLLITKQSKEELESFIKHHEGHSARVVVSTLKNNGIDIQVYHRRVSLATIVCCMLSVGKRLWMELRRR